jgi:alkylation response protein AidB-like acyl-CoA dehydrogenase
MLSTTRAERANGGYRFYGHKIFGSLSPVWTRFGLHAMDTSDPGQPKIVHAFMPRDTEGVRIVPTWDVLGMRAMLQHAVAEMRLTFDGMIAHVDQVAEDWSSGVDHGGLWPSKLVSANSALVDELVGKSTVGILGEEPRW